LVAVGHVKANASRRERIDVRRHGDRIAITTEYRFQIIDANQQHIRRGSAADLRAWEYGAGQQQRDQHNKSKHSRNPTGKKTGPSDRTATAVSDPSIR
jgi:hypothetical protein